MHDKPGVIIVHLNQGDERVKQEIDDALESGAVLLFGSYPVAVFARGYTKD